jgi:aminopeptidase N
MGEKQFYAFLQDYFQTYRYGFADSSGFLTIAEAACDCQLDDLFDLWVFEGGDPQLP